MRGYVVKASFLTMNLVDEDINLPGFLVDEDINHPEERRPRRSFMRGYVVKASFFNDEFG